MCNVITGKNASTEIVRCEMLTRYRDVGFLRYWKLKNIPLFLLPAPPLALLLYSSFTSISLSSYGLDEKNRGRRLISQLAVPQMVLAGLAITNYHVQVITRLSSGYPWLYIWLAKHLCQGSRLAQWATRFFMMYALIQGALFASFLPPA